MVLRAHASRLVAHHVASEVARDVAVLARSFRGPGSFARGDQLVRSALAVSSTIAEACGRGSHAEFRRFLIIARASGQELLSQLRIARDIEPALLERLVVLENRTALVLKLIQRLHWHPPPECS